MPKKKAKKEQPPSRASIENKTATSSSCSLQNLLLPASKISKKKKKFIIEELLPGYIWVVHDFLEPTECQAWIDFAEDKSRLDYMQHPATKIMANRECFRWQRQEMDIADTLFQRMQLCSVLKELEAKVDFPTSKSKYTPCACNPNIRLYKYEKGMSFGKHIDDHNTIPGVGQTEVTVLVYLSDCQGGATRFYPNTSGKRSNSVAIVPKRGAMLLHIHGDRCLEHEADAVVSGLKYILRTDIVYSKS